MKYTHLVFSLPFASIVCFPIQAGCRLLSLASLLVSQIFRTRRAFGFLIPVFGYRLQQLRCDAPLYTTYQQSCEERLTQYYCSSLCYQSGWMFLLLVCSPKVILVAT